MTVFNIELTPSLLAGSETVGVWLHRVCLHLADTKGNVFFSDKSLDFQVKVTFLTSGKDSNIGSFRISLHFFIFSKLQSPSLEIFLSASWLNFFQVFSLLFFLWKRKFSFHFSFTGRSFRVCSSRVQSKQIIFIPLFTAWSKASPRVVPLAVFQKGAKKTNGHSFFAYFFPLFSLFSQINFPFTHELITIFCNFISNSSLNMLGSFRPHLAHIAMQCSDSIASYRFICKFFPHSPIFNQPIIRVDRQPNLIKHVK